MRKRRSPRVVWLPQTNANSLGVPLTSAYQIFAVDISGPIGSFAVGEIPLTIDAQSDPLALDTSLADVENSGYRLRRIVGKIWCRYDQVDDSIIPRQLVVTAGIIVRRSDDQTGASLALLSGNPRFLSPGEIENAGDPWIWRRSWILGQQIPPQGSLIGPQPQDNYSGLGPCSGSLDGPHVDQKTARLVGPEERLFLDVSATVVVVGVDQEAVGSVTVITDLRCLASMRTSAGNRRNASR